MPASVRALSVLKLFSVESPVWTAEEIAGHLKTSMSTVYRHLAALTDAGMVTATVAGRYTLGPAIIQYDRQIQLTDPLLLVARPVMTELIEYAPMNSVILLCRLFHDSVLCVHQVAKGTTAAAVSYERGKPMPLFRGATSKIILAFLSPRALANFYGRHEGAIRDAKLGSDLEEFRANMRTLRRSGHSIARREVDRERIGIAAAILDGQKRVLGSLSYVLPEAAADDRMITRLASLVMTGAQQIEGAVSTASQTKAAESKRRK